MIKSKLFKKIIAIVFLADVLYIIVGYFIWGEIEKIPAYLPLLILAVICMILFYFIKKNNI